MFEHRHRCSHFGLFPNILTDHDPYLTCVLTKQLKDTRLESIIIKQDKLHTSLPLRAIIIHSIDAF